MADLFHWDFATEFTGQQIAALILGLDPAQAGAHPERLEPVLRRLDQAYREGLSRCWDRHSSAEKATAPKSAETDLRGAFVQALDQMASNGADDFSVQREIEGLWDRFDEDLFARTEVVRWLASTGMQSAYRFDQQAEGARRIDTPASKREEATYLTIIGALLELVRNPRDGRDSDAAVIRELIENFGDLPGISKTTLEAKFAAARRRLFPT